MTQAGVLLIKNNSLNSPILQAMGDTAKALRVALQPSEVSGPTEFESVFSAWVERQISGLVTHDHALLNANSKAITSLAVEHRISSIGPLELSAGGGLMAYGINFPNLHRRAAVFVDKILKGAKPAELPVEQSTKFELVVNLKTAKALGLELPATLLGRADEVIE
jgi:putative tryptophan/tyrosine transport system substrate-binding protein